MLATSVHPSLLRSYWLDDGRLRPLLVPVINHRHLAAVAAMQRVARASAAGGGGWPLSGGWRGLEARGGAQRARERAPEAARPPAPALVGRAAEVPGCQRRTPVPVTRGLLGLGHAAEGPAEASSPGRWRQVPDPDRLGALGGLDLAALVGLLGGLAGHAERGPDLGPGGSVAACSCGQKIACICQRVLGVSHCFQGVQGPLWAAQSRGQVVEHPAHSSARVAGLFGAHVNGYCSPPLTDSATRASFPIDATICDTAFSNSLGMRVASALSTGSGFRYRLTTEKKRPRAAPTAGVMDDIRGN